MEYLKFTRPAIAEILNKNTGKKFTTENIQKIFWKFKNYNGSYFRNSKQLEFIKSDICKVINRFDTNYECYYPKIENNLFLDLPIAIEINSDNEIVKAQPLRRGIK